MHLTKADVWSTLKQTTPPDEGINQTQDIFIKYDVKKGQEFIMLYLQMDVLQLADVFETLLRRLHLNTASILCTPTFYLVIHGKLV